MPPKASKTTRRRGESGNPATRAQQDTTQPIPQPQQVGDKYAATSWGSGGIGQLTDLTVPSGQLALVKRPGVEGLMAAGVLRNIDSLTALVQSKHLLKEDGKVNPQALLKDDEALAEILRTVDRVVTYCVVKPEIHMTPGDVTRRQPGVIYADMVDILDKMFIFNFAVGGSKELEPFRRGLEEFVGSLEAGEDVPGDAE